MRAFWGPMLCFAIMLAMPCVVRARAPEGLDNFGVFNKGRPTTSLSTMMSYANPAWQSDYEAFEIIGSSPIGSHLLTAGGMTSVGSKYAERSAYFLRFDWIFWSTSSISFKWSHEDWKYISSSKDSFGLEVNKFFPVGSNDGLYFSLGGYYRYLKQRWNNPWWAPLNLNTRDHEGYFTGAVGWKYGLNEKSFFTFDLNIRDAWSYYGLDHVAADLNWYPSGADTGFNWWLNIGLRTSAIFVGTAYPSIIYGGAGFIVY